MIIKRETGKNFGQISDLYDKARPTYPKQLVDRIITYSKIKSSGKVLDVGCGTGQATALFAEHGFGVVGLDVSREMIRVAKKNCSSFHHVKFKVACFEDVKFPAESFSLVVSGMAWHWANPLKRDKKAHHILNNKGTLALFWSYQRKEESDFLRAVGAILDRYGGPDRGPAGSRVKQIADMISNELIKNKLFTSVEITTYKENMKFSKQRYLDLVISYGWVHDLAKKEINNLKRDLQELFTKFEETLIIPYSHILVLAKKSKTY